MEGSRHKCLLCQLTHCYSAVKGFSCSGYLLEAGAVNRNTPAAYTGCVVTVTPERRHASGLCRSCSSRICMCSFSRRKVEASGDEEINILGHLQKELPVRPPDETDNLL